ncbi:MAG: hypothetical protein WD063_08535 [Pirellulales bacterium]
MSSYTTTIQKLGLTKESQGDAGWLYLLLTKLAAVDSSEANYAEPIKDALSRFASIEGQAGQRVAQMLTPHILQAAHQ